ncbi:RagB/SusD family nutrient uptake outer membrane protein [Chitinophaga sedimenti]|nr:RagB/SusD family nutrient uptake outer membrane protein [Chitinophaga sedimenti]MCK7557718.1 RagB/SusD family nutrient uptake outer membrane protein [Chitinophaga sedimenti]
MRKEKWIGKYTDPSTSTTYYYPFKYKTRTSTSPIEYSTLLRLAEIYLIRAEANTQLGDLDAGTKDLNLIRKRAGLNGIETLLSPITEKNLTVAILHERQVELFGELGHRWIDLKRTNMIDDVMTAEAVKKGSTWRNDAKIGPFHKLKLIRTIN